VCAASFCPAAGGGKPAAIAGGALISIIGKIVVDKAVGLVWDENLLLKYYSVQLCQANTLVSDRVLEDR
jgi:hypothetical protein